MPPMSMAPNSAPYVVLTYAFWHSRFQDDRGVVGRTIFLNKHPFTILGVAPPGFHGTVSFAFIDFFMPMVKRRATLRRERTRTSAAAIRWFLRSSDI